MTHAVDSSRSASASAAGSPVLARAAQRLRLQRERRAAGETIERGALRIADQLVARPSCSARCAATGARRRAMRRKRSTACSTEPFHGPSRATRESPLRRRRGHSNDRQRRTGGAGQDPGFHGQYLCVQLLCRHNAAIARGGSKLVLTERVKVIVPRRGHRSRADVDRRADAGHRVELLGECYRKPDAAVGRRITRVKSAMERDAVLVDALHPRHRRIVVLLRSIERLLVEHRENARSGSVSRPSRSKWSRRRPAYRRGRGRRAGPSG